MPRHRSQKSFASWLTNTMITLTSTPHSSLLGADLIDFQGEKINLQSKELELLGLENDDLCAQIARVKDLLSGQRKILDAMPERDRALFKAFQVFILDVLDALGGEEDTEGATSLAASAPEPTAEPESPAAARPRNSEREGMVVAEMLTKVFRLQNQGKMADAAALRETIPEGKVLGASALNKAALDLEHRLFCVGGFASIEALVDRVLQRPLVRQVLLSVVCTQVARCGPYGMQRPGNSRLLFPS